MNWNEENKFIIENEKRNDFIAKFSLAICNSGNTMILVKNVKLQKELYRLLKDVYKKENVWLINGQIKPEKREEIRKSLDNYNDGILIGSLSIMSTGINIKSLKNLIFAQVVKAEIPTIQSIGRAMRLHDSKDKAVIYDIVDDLVYTSRSGRKYKNYYYEHFLHRLSSYKKYGFPINPPEYIMMKTVKNIKNN